MIVDYRITIDDWYVDDDFNNKHVKMSQDIKLCIDDLIIKTIETKKIEVPLEPIEQDLHHEKPSFLRAYYSGQNIRAVTAF